jgi:hypothetical protein
VPTTPWFISDGFSIGTFLWREYTLVRAFCEFSPSGEPAVPMAEARVVVPAEWSSGDFHRATEYTSCMHIRDILEVLWLLIAICWTVRSGLRGNE